jgi:hypothetical protein
MALYILDANGNLKESQAGIFPTTANQGDLFYGSATNTISALAKNASSTRYLSNTGGSNNPAWAQVDLSNGVTANLPVGNLGSGTNASSSTFWRGDATWAIPGANGDMVWTASRVGWAFPSAVLGGGITYPFAGTNSAPAGISAGSASVPAINETATTAEADANGTTTNNNGSGVTVMNALGYAEWNPTITVYVRTGTDVSAQRVWVGLFGTSISTAGVYSSDTLGSITAAITFRYSTNAGDTGWVGLCKNGAASQTVSSVVAAVAANTVYKLRIAVTGTSSVSFTVNDGTPQTVAATIPATSRMALQLFIACVGSPGTAQHLYLQKASWVTN